MANARQMPRYGLDLTRRLAVMGIVNCTPDSFYDGGVTARTDQAVAAAAAAVVAGADVVDIGGLAFSPDTPDRGEAEEKRRIIDVVAETARLEVIVSVDTWRVGVAAAAVEHGATLINDVSGLADPRMAALAAEAGVGLVITHALARPHTHYPVPRYDDVTGDVVEFLTARVQAAKDAGVRDEQIIVDPGHDLNKNTRHSLELTRRLDEVAALGYPTLAAVSNKNFIGETLDLPKDQRLAGSLAAATFCFARGARMVRMHNVAPAVQAARMVEAILGWREPAYLRHNMS
ncbi:MAG: dihydropteroate synthase [Micrococcales bacterium]|nr:MAG: dihydropteroate synthase [Micrococcales bacterium]